MLEQGRRERSLVEKDIQKTKLKYLPSIVCVMKAVAYIVSLFFLNSATFTGVDVLASERSIIAELHNKPPSPCASKATDDTSSLIAISPQGVTREEVRNHMAAFAFVLLSSGANYMTSKYIDTVFTAVFYEKEPINEIGIYGYRFKNPINSNMFRAKPELNGDLFVINNKLLLVLWHEDKNKTNQCFSALKNVLSGYTQ